MVSCTSIRDADASGLRIATARLAWQDGQPYSLDYDDIYYHRGDGCAESEYVYLDANALSERFRNLQHHLFTVGELGFATGLNFFLTAKRFLETAPATAHLHYVACEALPLRLEDLKRIHQSWNLPLPSALLERFYQQYPQNIAGFHLLPIHERIHLLLLWGRAENLLPQLRARVNAWFWDGFNPAKNPEAFRPELLQWAAKNSADGATLSSFSSARILKEALLAAGFSIQKKAGFGRKREMITARLDLAPQASPCWTQAPPPRSAGQKIAIIGGGIAGSSTALALAPHHRVVVFDAGGSASRVPVALPYLHLDAYDTPMRRYHLSAWLLAQRVYQNLPASCFLPYFVDDWQLKPAQEAVLAELGAEKSASGWRYAAGKVQTEALLRHLQHDLEVRPQRVDIQAHANGWKVGDEIFDAVVLATGWQHDLLTPQLLYEPERSASVLQEALRPIRGQSSFFTGGTLNDVICAARSLIPQDDGVWVGGSFQPNNAELMPQSSDDIAHEALLKQHFAGDWQLQKHFVGIRSASRDYFPLLGMLLDSADLIQSHAVLRQDVKALRPAAVRPLTGLFINSALGSKAYSHAWLNAACIASLVNGSPSPLPTSLWPYLLPQRFVLRALSRRHI